MRSNLFYTATTTMLFITLFFSISPSFADHLDNWHVRAPSLTNATLNNIAYGNGQFVSVGRQGTIITSRDGTNWTSQPSGTAADLYGITYGNGMFVAVGVEFDAFTNLLNCGVILTSVDGESWTAQFSLEWFGLTSIAFGNGTFVAVGANSVVSIDGIHWTVNSLSEYLSSVTFADGQFFGLAGESTKIYTSFDGVTWGNEMAVAFDTCNRLTGIAYGNQTLVAVGGGCLTCFTGYPCRLTARSADLVHWDTTQRGFGGSLQSVTYAMSNFVAAGLNVIESTHDGINWKKNLVNSNYSLNAVAHGGNTFVAVGNNGVILQSDPVTQENVVIEVPTMTGWGMMAFILIADLGSILILRRQTRAL